MAAAGERGNIKGLMMLPSVKYGQLAQQEMKEKRKSRGGGSSVDLFSLTEQMKKSIKVENEK